MGIVIVGRLAAQAVRNAQLAKMVVHRRNVAGFRREHETAAGRRCRRAGVGL
ncbi:MAG: hypothetical protein IPG68_04815 [Micrococcales bacterium]|nr:hypothetical protein [Micrococcales bacterium]